MMPLQDLVGQDPVDEPTQADAEDDSCDGDPSTRPRHGRRAPVLGDSCLGRTAGDAGRTVEPVFLATSKETGMIEGEVGGVDGRQVPGPQDAAEVGEGHDADRHVLPGLGIGFGHRAAPPTSVKASTGVLGPSGMMS
jgi:hypothetical protein